MFRSASTRLRALRGRLGKLQTGAGADADADEGGEEVETSTHPSGTSTWSVALQWPLCNLCRFMLSSTFGWDRFARVPETYHQSISFEVLAENAASGDCSVCLAIFKAHQRFEPVGGIEASAVLPWLSTPDTLVVQPLYPFGRRGVKRFIYVRQDAQHGENGVPGGGGVEAMFDIKTDEDGSLNSEGFAFIQQAMRRCLTSPKHSECRPAPNFRIEWPERILRVAPEHVFLVDFDRTMIGRFAALSYCWGSKEELRQRSPLQLTAASSGRLRSGIPVSELPLTLRQAVSVCSRLQLEFVWVDALCITQDDPADWANEAKKMATVYTMSIVTIIAAASHSCHSGFLSRHLNAFFVKSPLAPPARLLAQLERSSGVHKGIREVSDPIDERGWTFQEELLSARFIKFTNDDVQWRCNAGTSCLCRQSDEPEDHPRPNASLGFLKGDLSRGTREQWHDIATGFSKKQLTIDTDKLAALAGLARRKEPEIRSKYVAGLWTDHMELPPPDWTFKARTNALAWYSVQKRPSYRNYIAPTFSWASVDSPVSFQPILSSPQPLVRITDVGTTPISTQDPFGRVSGGYMRLVGPLKQCTVHQRDGTRVPVIEIPEFLKTRSPISCRMDCTVRRGPVQFGRGSSLYRCSDGGDVPFEETTAHLLFLYRDAFDLTGLLLGRQWDSEGGSHHHRLGHFRLGLVEVHLSEEVQGSEVDEFLEPLQQTLTIY